LALSSERTLFQNETLIEELRLRNSGKELRILEKSVREVLIQIVEEKGREVFSRSDELERLLTDLCHDKKRELSAIFPAIRAGLSKELCEACELKPIDLAIENVSDILLKEHALSSEAALWAIDSIAIAIGLTNEEELGEIRSRRALSKKKEYERITRNGDNLVIVQGGSFVMGNSWDSMDDMTISSEMKKDLKRQKPPHKVSFSHDFYIGKYPVTFEEYDRFCEDLRIDKPDARGWGRERRPVINVTWFEAAAYCNWLSDREGRPRAYDNGGNLLDKNCFETADPSLSIGYRLPSEAEWEYAARGGKKSVGFLYAGSNDPERVAWFIENSSGRKFDPRRPERAFLSGKTHEVGQKAANELGLYDMSGNVWEWCSDWCAKYRDTPCTNPYHSEGTYRVARGGGWGNVRSGITVAKRGGDLPTNRTTSLGFRVCITTE